MKKLISTFLVVAALLCGVCPSAYACTTILVGKDASADGSAYAGRTNDDVEMLSAKIEIFPASKGPGTYVFVDPENGAEVTLPKANHRCIIEPVYNKCPDIWWESGFNDAGVGISATETIRINDAVLAIDPFTKSGISEANIPRLVLPYISSAKEGVMRLGSLVEQYGMTAPEAVAFIDDDGIWYIEVLSGHQWAAHRLPDDEYACIGNDCLLDFYNPDDTENWIGSAGVRELAEKSRHLYRAGWQIPSCSFLLRGQTGLQPAENLGVPPLFQQCFPQQLQRQCRLHLQSEAGKEDRLEGYFRFDA